MPPEVCCQHRLVATDGSAVCGAPADPITTSWSKPMCPVHLAAMRSLFGGLIPSQKYHIPAPRGSMPG